ncbi:hypothetical protein [Novosphingobium sp. SG720]|uniref:hypothetical protein n=1 Tax=Novosphingobium sp. SG720 TaxID=2586998 RepID=UPI001FF0D1C0|nr:hypothetical protein [Novosphingobium sp. SG720]
MSGRDYVSLSLAASEFGPRRLYANLGRHRAGRRGRLRDHLEPCRLSGPPRARTGRGASSGALDRIAREGLCRRGPSAPPGPCQRPANWWAHTSSISTGRPRAPRSRG